MTGQVAFLGPDGCLYHLWRMRLAGTCKVCQAFTREGQSMALGSMKLRVPGPALSNPGTLSRSSVWTVAEGRDTG